MVLTSGVQVWRLRLVSAQQLQPDATPRLLRWATTAHIMQHPSSSMSLVPVCLCCPQVKRRSNLQIQSCVVFESQQNRPSACVALCWVPHMPMAVATLRHDRSDVLVSKDTLFVWRLAVFVTGAQHHPQNRGGSREQLTQWSLSIS